jgi:hypothetical protein
LNEQDRLKWNFEPRSHSKGLTAAHPGKNVWINAYDAQAIYNNMERYLNVKNGVKIYEPLPCLMLLTATSNLRTGSNPVSPFECAIFEE